MSKVIIHAWSDRAECSVHVGPFDNEDEATAWYEANEKKHHLSGAQLILLNPPDTSPGLLETYGQPEPV